MDQTLEAAANVVLADLASNGGGTYESKTLLPFNPSDGYAVGTKGIRLEADQVNVESVQWALRHVAGEFLSSFVGTWQDDGVVYFDAVIYTKSRERALALGRYEGQKAIYGFAEKESIPCE